MIEKAHVLLLQEYTTGRGRRTREEGEKEAEFCTNTFSSNLVDTAEE
jgi:hypothetical protein